MTATAPIDITAYAETAGRRTRSFALEGFRVLVDRNYEATDAEHAQFTGRLADAPRLVTELTVKLREAKQQIPPTRPARMLGAGCVRWDADKLWLLNTQEKGWSAFGIQLDSWDQLFRTYAVRVIGAGQDEHGPFALVEPMEVK